MRRRSAMMAAAAVLGTLLSSTVLPGTVLPGGASAGAAVTQAPAARAVVPDGTWGTAQPVRGIITLNAGRKAALNSVSCVAPGQCSAGGYYTDSAKHTQGYLVDQNRGNWGTAQQVPGLAALNLGGRAAITSMSCTPAGDCAAGGYYTDVSGLQQAFVVDKTGGVWGTAQQVPGIGAINRGKPGATVLSLACGAAGDCGAGGYYSDVSGHRQAFVVSESGGTWGTAQEVPGTASLNAGGFAAIASVSCPATGSCGAGGYYASSNVDGIPIQQALVVSETGGTWGTARKVPGTARLNTGGYAAINSVSCASAGNCSAGGEYTNGTATQAMVVSQSGGTWGTARQVPGITTLNQSHLAQVNAVSCASPGNCAAGGSYQDASFVNQVFVVDEASGTWGTAKEVPGTAALNAISPGASLTSISCPAAGDCTAGGSYTGSAGDNQAYVVDETSGTWGNAQEVPGSAALNAGGHAALSTVFCGLPGTCSAGGQYTRAGTGVESFVVSETG
ncbi:MAG TPA: hypothetical protein VGS62_06665 [Streptosporangiaceae bacterium]|nr:hypothetical protein [Streptosporangiaceae bacterium]